MAKEKAKTGRPTDYGPHAVRIAKAMAKLGATDPETAEAIGIDVATLYRWRHAHPEFCDALKVGKEESDDRVEKSLYQRAIGYTYQSEKIFQFQGAPVVVPYTEHVLPDVTAQIFWLKNRRRAQWTQDGQSEKPAEQIQTVRIEVVGADPHQGD